MKFSAVLFIILLTLSFDKLSTSGALTNIPQNVAVLSGTQVELECGSNSRYDNGLYKPVEWSVTFLNSTQILIWSKNYMSIQLRFAYAVNSSDTTGQFNLIINSTDRSTAGRYTCTDSNGVASTSSADVIVLESSTQCFCNVNSSTVRCVTFDIILTCRTAYFGSFPPIMDFQPSIRSAVLISIPTSNNVALYQYSFKAGGSFNGSLTCTTKFDQPTSPNIPSFQENISFPLLFLYGPATCEVTKNGDTYTCSANSYPGSTYTWFDNLLTNEVGQGRTIIGQPNRTYSCMASSTCQSVTCYYTTGSVSKDNGQATAGTGGTGGTDNNSQKNIIDSLNSADVRMTSKKLFLFLLFFGLIH